MSGRPAVFLDRDGVLNRAVVRGGRPYPPADLAELEILPGVSEAARRLADAGFLLIGVTNQPDVARGTQTRAAVEALNAAVRAAVPLDELLVCYDDSDTSPNRKPNPGLLLDAARRHGVDLAASFMVGDRWKDIEAGRRAGCRTILVDYGYAEPWHGGPADQRVGSLAEAVRIILGAREQRAEARRPSVRDLRIKIFADGADKRGMVEMYRNPLIRGFTTNPTLMRKSGITDYEAFARDVLAAIPDRPISFEVFSDDFEEMVAQARQIAAWGPNVYVKIPVTNTHGQPATAIVRRLAHEGIHLNVTALMTLAQVRDVAAALADGPPSCVSVFAGRIADTGRDPTPVMAAAVALLEPYPHLELIWASPREVLNVFQADAVGCHIITATNDILKKLDLVGKDLSEFSLDTVKMFRNDAVSAGFQLAGTPPVRGAHTGLAAPAR